MRKINLRILDFDGTVTDAEAEGAPYTESYLRDLSVLTNVSLDSIKARATECLQLIHANPDQYGFEFKDKIVAPAMVDPYLRMGPIAKQIFEDLLPNFDPEFRRRLFQVLYRHNYAKSATVFRPGAHEVLTRLYKRNAFVVTNSDTGAVIQKILTLGNANEGLGSLVWLVDHVYGNAQKFNLDDIDDDEGLDKVPETMEIPGLSRLVYLRRTRYFNVLNSIRRGFPVHWDEVAVAGDIFELDLALPLALGAQVALVVSKHTPGYEVDFVSDHPNGTIINDLSQLPTFFQL